MSTDNPYSPPQSEVADPYNDVAGELRESPRSNPAGHGWAWLSQGFALFKAAPGIWIVNVILLVVILFLLLLIPFIGSLFQSMLSSVLGGGLLLGARAVDRGEPLTVNHLFAGFSRRPLALMGVGAISLIGTILIFVIAILVSGLGFGTIGALDGGELTPGQLQQLAPLLIVMGLVTAGLMVPLMMMVWFAPALVVMHEDMGVFGALKLSFVGCLKNLLPFLVYGLIGLLLTIVATIPLGLGWLVLGPMIFGSVYAGYKDIFVE